MNCLSLSLPAEGSALVLVFEPVSAQSHGTQGHLQLWPMDPSQLTALAVSTTVAIRIDTTGGFSGNMSFKYFAGLCPGLLSIAGLSSMRVLASSA